MGDTSLLTRWARLKAEARQHKAAIRRHREQLCAVTADLAAIERESRRMGIALIDVTPAPAPHAKAS